MNMTVYEFLKKLNRFYPTKEKEEIFTERVNEYADIILARSRERGEKYDYDKVFKHIFQTKEYSTYPSLPEILKALEYGIIVQESFSGHEGEVIKRVINGHEYEFTVVPNHWKGVKTIEQLDKEIEQRRKEENYA